MGETVEVVREREREREVHFIQTKRKKRIH